MFIFHVIFMTVNLTTCPLFLYLIFSHDISLLKNININYNIFSLSFDVEDQHRIFEESY